VNLEQLGSLIAVISAVLVAARVIFVTEERVKRLDERLDDERTTSLEHEKQIQAHGQDLVGLQRDHHALRSQVQANDMRVEKAIASLETRVDKRLDSIEEMLKRALEDTAPGRAR